MKKIVTLRVVLTAILISCSKESSIINNQSAISDVLSLPVVINADTVWQTIQGFGGASILAWEADLTSDQRVKAFSTSDGIGLSILRVMVPTSSSNFAAEKPTIDAAKSYGAKVIATAWNAPDSMMSNLTLKTSSYASYAAYLKSYNTAVGGVYAISPWNEPNYASSGWMHATATEVANFVAAYGSSCGAPIMAPEPFNMDQSFINTYLSNATATSKTSFVCGHIYGATPYNLGNIGKEVWMTEHFTNSSVSGNDWSNAMTAAKEINDCMSAGWSAYVWWYIRRSYGFIDESGNITKLGYVTAQFARYIRPGYSRIACTANPMSGVYITAYKNDSKLVVVAINQNAFDVDQPFNWSGITVTGFNRYVTTNSSNLAADNQPSSGASIKITLLANSVTTLVSQ